MRRRILGLSALALFGAIATVVACGDTPSETVVATCTPGRSLACAGPSGCKGFQTCRSDGTFDECSCPDASVVADADVPDGEEDIDGGRRDASRDAPRDAPLDVPVDAPVDAPLDVVEEDAPADVAVDVSVPPAGWGVSFLGPYGNSTAVAVDATKNVVVAGHGPAASLTKLAANGVVIWQKQLADLVDVAVDQANGSIYVTGTANANTDFGGGVVSASGWFVAKYDTNGVYQWLFGPFGNDVTFRQLAVRGNGNVVVVGTLDQTTNLGSGVMTQTAGADALLVELTGAGSLVRAKQWGDGGRQELGSVAFDANGSLVVGGSAESSIDFGGGAMTGPPANSGAHNAFVVKLDANANFLGQRATGSTGTDFINVYGPDSLGRLLVGGGLQSKMNFGAGDLTSVSSADIVIAALDSSLTQVWAKQFGQVAGPLLTGLAANPAGGFSIVGWSTGAVSFGLGGLPALQFPFVVRFDGNGTPLANFAPTGQVYVPTDLAWISGNDFVMTGKCVGPSQIVFPWGSMKCVGSNGGGYVSRVTP